MTNFERTASWLKACGKEPTPENLSVQIGVHLEEFAEFMRCLSVVVSDAPGRSVKLAGVVDNVAFLGSLLKNGTHIAEIASDARQDALDALCDCEVTGNGVAYMAGFRKPEADAAVLASNDAKLVDGAPVILPGGKIGKPPGWQAPDLSPFV